MTAMQEIQALLFKLYEKDKITPEVFSILRDGIEKGLTKEQEQKLEAYKHGWNDSYVPTTLHQRYQVNKILPNGGVICPDLDAEYFVMRLDIGGKDIEHIKACRIGVHAYADAIHHHLPELAKDLRERYPLL